MNKLNEIELLFLKENLPFWQRLKAKEKDLILYNINMKTMTAGTKLNRDDRECNGLILLQSGTIRAFIVSEDGHEITLYRLIPGDICIMSASCILKNIRFTIYLDIEITGKMFVIPANIYKKINNENLAVKEFSMNLMSDKFSEVVNIIDQRIFGSITEILSKYLVDLSNTNRSLKLDLTHDSISKDIGTAREVVSRMLKSFERQGLVKLSRGSVMITNKKELETITAKQ